MDRADTDTLDTLARRLGSVLEPVIGQVYFSPECHANYVALGFDPSPGEAGGVAAAFGVFNPDAVIPAVALGWSHTDAATICSARAGGGYLASGPHDLGGRS